MNYGGISFFIYFFFLFQLSSIRYILLEYRKNVVWQRVKSSKYTIFLDGHTGLSTKIFK